MGKREEIIKLYFDENYSQKEIVRKLNTSKRYVSKVLLMDSRYNKEKEARKEQNEKKHIENTKEYIKQKRKSNQLKNKSDDLILTNLHRTASVELSRRRKLSSIAYRNWNTSAYTYNKEKNRFEFREELGRSYDVPKFVKEKI